jgi:translocation and assembly module TamA
VLAGRVNVGAIAGSQRNRIPADERFYAGGGGSIRGYEHQKVGPLRDDTPLGGRSLLEFSIEARTRISNRFGIVPFIDGGTVFESAYPTFGRTLRWGAGIGFRYFSPIGPIRFDVAVPLNRRSGIDKAFQIYISLGQAF